MSRGLLFKYKHVDDRYRPIIPIELEYVGIDIESGNPSN